MKIKFFQFFMFYFCNTAFLCKCPMGPSDNIKVVFGLKVIGEKKAVETKIEIFLL